ncbi:hypothetical protein HanRHA438_Chr00c07g0846801 [Helianthus annuus]|nr:hypothetical protein HanRHA438_Chr00c07g0846801 [Helianthus annuus]
MISQRLIIQIPNQHRIFTKMKIDKLYNNNNNNTNRQATCRVWGGWDVGIPYTSIPRDREASSKETLGSKRENRLKHIPKIIGLLDFITLNYWPLAAAIPDYHFDSRHPQLNI